MSSDSLAESLEETLAVFDESGSPQATTEVAERLDLGRRSTYERLERLVDQGELETKKVGASGRVWWRPRRALGDSDTAPPAGGSILDDALDVAEVGVFVLDADFDVAWINDAAERYFGLDREQVLGRDKRQLVEERIAPRIDDSESFTETVLATYDDNTYAEEFECRVTADEGREARWLEHRSEPIDAGAYAGGRIELYSDVSDQERRKREERENREQFESLVETVEEYAIFLLDPEGYIRTWNPGAEWIKGYTSDEAICEHFSMFYTEDDRAAGRPERNLRKAAEEGSIEDEGWRLRDDGSRFWANVTITAIRDDDGDLIGYAKVTRDMTDRRNREAERKLQSETARDIAEADTFEDGLQAALRDVCELTDWEFAEVWLPTGEGTIRRADVDYYESEFAEFGAFSEGYTFDSDEGLPGRVWASGEFEWAADLSTGSVEAYPRLESALDVDLKSSLGVPIVADGEVVAVLTFLMSEVRDTDERLVEIVSSVAANLGDLVVRRQIEREREHERNLIDQILTASPVGILVLDSDGTIDRTNDRAEELLGVAASEVEGRPYDALDWDIWDEDGDSIPLDDHPVSRVLASGSTVLGYDHGITLPDGTDRWLSTDAAPVSDGAGGVERVVVTIEDVTQLREQSRRLERQRDDLEAEIEDVFDRISDGFYGLDENLQFTYLNEQTEALLGIEESTVIGREIQEVLDLTDEFEAALHEALEGQTPISREDYYEPLDAWFQNAIYPSESGLSVYFRDVTEQKAREKQLEQYKALTEAARDVIVTIDETSTIHWVNPAVEDVLGYTPDELEGESLTVLMPESLREQHLTAIQRYLETGQRNLDWNYVELPGRTKSGDEIPLAVSFSEAESDGMHFFTGVIRDITERKEREQQLQERIRQQESIAEFGQRALRDHDVDALMADATALIADVLDNDYCKVLDLDADAEELLLRQGVGWQEGIVGSATVSAVEDDSQAAYTLATDRPVVVTDLETESRFSGPDLLTDHDIRSGISTIIGPPDDPWGILGTHDTSVREFSEHDVNFVQSMANILFTAITRHRNEQALERQREQLVALNNLNDVVHDITDAVITQSTREEIEEIVCERLAATDSYTFAWIGEVDTRTQTVALRTEAGVEGYLDGMTISVDPDDPRSRGATGRAIIEEEIQTTQNILEDPDYEQWREHMREHGVRSSAAIPIVHEDTVYGVLNVYADRPHAFTDEERVVIGQLGEIVGHAIASVQRKQALMSDQVVELDFQIEDVFDLLDLSVSTDGEITLDQTVAAGEDSYLIYGTATEDAMAAVEALVASEEVPHWESVTVTGTDGDVKHFVVRLVGPPVLSAITAAGGYVEEAKIEDGDYYMTLHLAPTVDASRVIDTVRDAYPTARLVTKRQITRETVSKPEIDRLLEADLTDRQRSALRAAFYAGYFDWPRETTGEDVAESLGVSAPTFHQHLRKALHTVLAAVLDDKDSAVASAE